MKKLIAILLASVLLLGLAACKQVTPANTAASSAASTAASGSAAKSAAASSAAASASASASTSAASSAAKSSTGTKDFKVAMICDSSISDGGWGTACYNAMVDACKKSGWSYEVTDSIDQSAYYESIAAYCDLGYNMIYAPGNQYTDAVLQAAEEYPDISFALLNGAEDTPGKATNKNVSSLLPNAQQIGWIAGALAGLMTKTNTIAFIGGMELDTTLGKYKGYTEAAKFVNSSVKVLDPVYAGSFSATDKGIEFAKAMIDQGADVFFGDASAVDSGARQAIDEANKASGSVKVYDIGQPADLLGQNECVICSQVTDNSSLLALCMQAVEDGKFGGETVYGTLQNGVLSAGKMSDLIPKDVQTKYLGYIDQMSKDTFMK
jgi:basic membrane protein A